MKKIAFAAALLFAFAKGWCQPADNGKTSHVKTRYLIQTLITQAGKHVDTARYEQFNPAQKEVLINGYRDNRLNYKTTVDIDAKNQTRSINTDNIGSLPSRTDYYYNSKGLITRTIDHRYGKYGDGKAKEVAADTVKQTFDERGNLLSYDGKNAHKDFVYDAQNHLIQQDFYMNRSHRPQRENFIYVDNLLLETRSLWFDGTLYKHVTNKYNKQGHLTDSRDSTTNWLQLIHKTYNNKGQLATEVQDKTWQGKHSTTTLTYTYNGTGKLANKTIVSDDNMLIEAFMYRTRVAEARPPYNMVETYEYDLYGNRLKITTTIGGKLVGTTDFLMTYYP